MRPSQVCWRPRRSWWAGRNMWSRCFPMARPTFFRRAPSLGCRQKSHGGRYRDPLWRRLRVCYSVDSSGASGAADQCADHHHAGVFRRDGSSHVLCRPRAGRGGSISIQCRRAECAGQRHDAVNFYTGRNPRPTKSLYRDPMKTFLILTAGLLLPFLRGGAGLSSICGRERRHRAGGSLQQGWRADGEADVSDRS